MKIYDYFICGGSLTKFFPYFFILLVHSCWAKWTAGEQRSFVFIFWGTLGKTFTLLLVDQVLIRRISKKVGQI